MKTYSFLIAVLFGAAVGTLAQTPSIPEPGLFIYGPVVNRTNQLPVQATAVQWQVSSATEGVTVNSTIVTVNGQPYFVARVPFETRAIGTQNFSKTFGVLELKTASTTYNRTATCDGLPGAILSSSLSFGPTFTFSSATRGIAERLVLGVNKTPIGVNPGQTNLVIGADLTVNGFGALSLSWGSVQGETYSVLRATNVSGPYVPIIVNAAATPPKNTFSDASPLTNSAVFYRITGTP